MQTQVFSEADIKQAREEGYRHGRTDRMLGRRWADAWDGDFATAYGRAYAVAYTQGYAEGEVA